MAEPLHIPTEWPARSLSVRERIAADWTTVRWLSVYEEMGFAPTDLPGVRPLRGMESRAWPFVHEVHRSLLPLIGEEGARAQGRWLRDAGLLSLSKAALDVLRPHQRTAAAFLRGRRGVLLADEQRLGKTPTALYAHDPSDGPCFVVGPVAARVVWHEWAARRFGACGVEGCATCARVGAAAGSRSSFVALLHRDFKPQVLTELRPQVIFVSLALVPFWEELYAHLDIGTLVVDECHLAGVQSRGSKTVEALRKLGTVSKRIIYASGTPLTNRPQGLWPILDNINPGSFGDFWDYARRYAGARPTAHGWQAKGATRQEELATRLGEVMIRRRWADVQDSLPPITRSVDLVEIDEQTANEARALAARVRALQGGAQTVIGDLARLRQLFAKFKIDRAVEIVEELRHAGQGCVVWTWHREVAEQIARWLTAEGMPPAALIHGGIKAAARETLIECARTDAMPIIVATMGCLATAVNLSFLSHQIFVELDWTPVTIAQAEMRPFDGKHPISSTFLVADCDIDRQLVDNILPKLANASALGLSASGGDVRETLCGVFGCDPGQTLDQLAERLMANAEAEC